MPWSIRPARHEDLQEIIELRKRVSLEAYDFDKQQIAFWVNRRHRQDEVLEEFQGQYPTLMLVAETQSRIIGTAYAKLKPQDHGADAYIGGLYVDAHWQRQGMGKQLLAMRLDWLTSKGAFKVLTEVEYSNQPAKAFLKSFGFKEQSVMNEKYVDGMKWSVQTLEL